MSYFKHFPTTTHSNYTVLDITRRVKLIERVINEPMAFLPYMVEEDMRPEDVALYYYGTVDYTWLIYIANNIVDPYHDWPMTQENFERYLMKKYAAQSGLKNYGIMQWLQSPTNPDNIKHYAKLNDPDNIISKDTFTYGNLIPGFSASEWVPVRLYDYEFELNERKRSINLINQTFAPQMDKELKSLLNE